jgi:hypothetical protein
MTITIGLNSFVLRQTADSSHSHYNGGDLADLPALVAEHFGNATPGYKDGVVLVPVPPERFQSGVVVVDADTQLRAVFEARRPGENPYLSTLARGVKAQAVVVEIVLYSRAALGDEATTDCDWEIISINARATRGWEPMQPVAMMRNFLAQPGGTAAIYTAEEFAQSILYWSTRAMCDGI